MIPSTRCVAIVMPLIPFYYMLRLRKEDGTDEAIRYKVFDLKNTLAIVWGTPKMPFYFVRLKDLIMAQV